MSEGAAVVEARMSSSTPEETWAAAAGVEAHSAGAAVMKLASMLPLVAEEVLVVVSRQIGRLALVFVAGLLLVVL